MAKITLRWHSIQVRKYQLRWYLGTRDNHGYGWKVNRKRICLGPLFVTMWRETSPGRFKQGWRK
jgi:hypothetical protein